jgi:abhydrolase domain-containing protein 6
MAIERRTINIHENNYLCLIGGKPHNPAIVMIHGWAHHPDIWTNTIEFYQKQYFCVAVGVLGLGECDKPAHGDYRIQAHACDTLDIVDALHIDRFILMGQSRGGQIALCLASQIAPERIIKLVDVSGVVTGKLTDYMRWVMRPLIWMNCKFALCNAFGRMVFQYYRPVSLMYKPYFADIRKVPREIIIKDFRISLQPDARFTTYRCMQTMQETNLVPNLYRICAPTLIIFGEKDGCVPPEEGMIAHKYITDSEFVLIKDCGHYPMVESSEAYFRALKTFIPLG